ncbi:hypothetical protein KXS07_03415 [Inquilinus limosus]|uniref:hypothetical protein n=1 Tax=Inquilinus limosus TaxID=171674 RepID=UPI003F16A632
MTTFQQYVSKLAPGRTYALAIPELSYSRYRGDLTAAKDFYLYGLAIPDEVINHTIKAWTEQTGCTDGIYLLPAALSYLTAAAKENGHIILDVAVPDWPSLAYESLPFLYIDNDKMIFERTAKPGIQLTVGSTPDSFYHIFLDLQSNDQNIGKSGVFRIVSAESARDYSFLDSDFVHGLTVERSFCETMDRIFVADIFTRCLPPEPPSQPGADSAMRQLLSFLSNIWDDTQGRRGYNIAAALAEEDKSGGFGFLLFVPNEKKRNRIAHAETRVVSFMNVVCQTLEWQDDSDVVAYISKLSRLPPDMIVKLKARFLSAEKESRALAFFSTLQPCYMCRAEPDGATIEAIKAIGVGGQMLDILPGGATLRSSFGGTYIDRMGLLYYYDMDANIFYPRVVDDRISDDAGSKNVILRQLPTPGYVSPDGRAVFGPVAVGNAKEDYATAAARERIRNSGFVSEFGSGRLSFKPDRSVNYSLAGPEQAPVAVLPVGMTTQLAGATLSQTATKSETAETLSAAAPAAEPPAAPGAAAPARSGQLTTEQIRLLQRAAVLLGTLGQG